MKALVARRLSATPVLEIEERDHPSEPAPGRTLVSVRAVTVNQLSNTILTGRWGASAPLVLGNEGSGVVEESDRFEPGTRVAIYGGGELGITEDGLLQEVVSIETDRLVELPAHLDFAEGAALTVNYLTAYRALTKANAVRPGQTVLVSGATGSVGGALVQVATALGARAIALVSTSQKASLAKASGASASIDLSTQDVGHEISQLTGNDGVDAAFDPVGGQRFEQLLAALRRRGTLVSIGFTGGGTPPIDLTSVIVRELNVTGYALHSENLADIADAMPHLMTLISQAGITPPIDSRYTFETILDGYERLRSRKATGSLVLELPAR